MADKYYAVGQGKVYVATRDSAGQTSGFTWIGDADGFSISGTEQTLSFRESYSGNRARVLDIVTQTDLGFSIGIRNIDGANLARAFYGTAAAATGATVASESINAYAGSMVPLKHPGVSSVVVTKTTPGTALVAGVDYTLDAVNGTVTFLSGSTLVTGTSAVPCTVAYTYASYATKLEALTTTAKEYVFRFEGKSQFDNKAQIATFYRAKPGIAAALDLIGSDVAVLTLTGALLPAAEVSTGSPYFTYVQA
jgi:hypothetical protein